MDIFSVNSADFRYLEACIPKCILAGVRAGRGTLLCCAEDGHPKGVTVYSLYNGNYLLDWIYVEQGSRRQGYGTVLLIRAIENMMREDMGDNLLVRYNPDEPPEGLEPFLESFAFWFRDRTIPVYSFTPAQVTLPQGIEKKVDCSKILGISDLLREWKTDFEKHLEGVDDADLIELPISWKSYSSQLSVARVCNKKIEGILLIKESEDGLELSFAYACSDKSMTFMLMVIAAFDRIRKKYGNDVTITVAAVTEHSEDLVNRLVPDTRCIAIREGIYVLRE